MGRRCGHDRGGFCTTHRRTRLSEATDHRSRTALPTQYSLRMKDKEEVRCISMQSCEARVAESSQKSTGRIVPVCQLRPTPNGRPTPGREKLRRSNLDRCLSPTLLISIPRGPISSIAKKNCLRGAAPQRFHLCLTSAVAQSLGLTFCEELDGSPEPDIAIPVEMRQTEAGDVGQSRCVNRHAVLEGRSTC